MRLALRQIKVYLRLALVLTVLVVVAVVLFNNRNYSTPVWFFGLTNPERPLNVVWLIIWTATATRTAQWVFSFGWGLWREMRELKRVRATQQEKEAQEQRAVELDERERRLEKILKRGIESEEADTKE